MIEVRALERLSMADLRRIAHGYSSDAKYVVVLTETEESASIKLRLVALGEPYVKKFDPDAETLRRYVRVLKQGFSFGAYEGELLVGLLIAEAERWNRSLRVSEFHVAETHRGMGIGRRLMERAAEQAVRAGLRIIVCETQNTNPTAVEVYRRLGFGIEGVDISFYSNADYPDGEIAIFMKRRLP